MKNTKYFNVFKQHANYEIFKENNNIFPHMSYCEDYNEIHFNHDTQIIITFNVLDDNSETYIYTGDDEDPNFNTRDQFSKIEIDGTEINLNDLPIQSAEYPLSVGTHIIKYTLIEPIIKDYTFCACNCITGVIIPKYVNTIELGAFEGCVNLVDLTLSSSITTIGDNAFNVCNNLGNLVIPNSVRTIGLAAFGNCDNLHNVTIGTGVTYIDEFNFQFRDENNEQCIFTVLPTTPPTLEFGLGDNEGTHIIVYVPAESLNAYKTATNWSNIETLYGGSILAIPNE